MNLKTHRIWTADEDQFMIDNYADMSSPKIATALNRTEKSIYCRATTLKLKKSSAFLSSEASGRLLKGGHRGVLTRFKKGQIPPNKGKKMPAEIKERIKHTFFKPGHKPHNTKFDGATTIRKDKKGTKYLYIRISESEWQPLHRYNWEQKHGKIPERMNLIFKDRNTMNCEIENLELVTNEELMTRNTIHRYPDDLKQIIRINSKINKKVTKLKQNGTK